MEREAEAAVFKEKSGWQVIQQDRKGAFRDACHGTANKFGVVKKCYFS